MLEAGAGRYCSFSAVHGELVKKGGRNARVGSTESGRKVWCGGGK